MLLWLVFGLTMAVFGYEPCAYDDRTEVLITMFLAAAATLYVVSEKLPTVSFLTPIDKLVVATLLCIFGVQMQTIYLNVQCQAGETAHAEKVDDVTKWALPALYSLFNLIVFGPRTYRVWSAGNRPWGLPAGAEFTSWDSARKIDHNSSDDVILGSRRVSSAFQHAQLVDTDGDGIADAIDLDGDGVVDANMTKEFISEHSAGQLEMAERSTTGQ